MSSSSNNNNNEPITKTFNSLEEFLEDYHRRQAEHRAQWANHPKPKCVLCSKPCDCPFGNNAQPVKEGVCCDKCNATKVIPARMGRLPPLPKSPSQSDAE